jgi:phage gp36-like protein
MISEKHYQKIFIETIKQLLKEKKMKLISEINSVDERRKFIAAARRKSDKIYNQLNEKFKIDVNYLRKMILAEVRKKIKEKEKNIKNEEDLDELINSHPKLYHVLKDDPIKKRKGE